MSLYFNVLSFSLAFISFIPVRKCANLNNPKRGRASHSTPPQMLNELGPYVNVFSFFDTLPQISLSFSILSLFYPFLSIYFLSIQLCFEAYVTCFSSYSRPKGGSAEEEKGTVKLLQLRNNII